MLASHVKKAVSDAHRKAEVMAFLLNIFTSSEGKVKMIFVPESAVLPTERLSILVRFTPNKPK